MTIKNIVTTVLLILWLSVITGASAQAQIRILPLGDSITQGGGQPSYRRALWFKLQNAGADVDFVGSHAVFDSFVDPNLQDFDLDNEGHWGWEAGEIDNNINVWLQGYDADIVLMHLGTNDIDGGQSVNSTLVELGSIVAKLRADNPNVVILVAQIIPIRTVNVVPFNTAIVSWAAGQNTAQSPVVVVDQFTSYDENIDSYDRYHPNDLGEEKMATRWFDALQPFLSEINSPPSVSAGVDQSVIAAGDVVTLQGTTSDDGLPNGSTLTQQWSVVLGPGTATFSSTTSPITSVSFSVEGTYVLRLQASDTVLTASDDVTIQVGQFAPTVNAGADQSIQLPTSSVQLNSTIDDDGLPNNAITFSWAQVSGPGTSNIVPGILNGNTLLTDVTVTTPGIYVLRLTASDGALSSSDDVQITLEAEDVPPPTGESPVLSGVSAFWRFDENAGIIATDSSGIGNTGALQNLDASHWQPGVYNNALCLDGSANQQVSITNPIGLDTPSVTVAGWIKLNPNISNWVWIGGHGDNYGLYVYGDGIYFYIYTGSTWKSVYFDNAGLLDSEWHHVAGSFDADTGIASVFKDGVLLNEAYFPDQISYVSGSGASIGSMQGLRSFDGCLDEIQFYGRALSETEVNSLASMDVTPPLNTAPSVSAGADQSIQLPTSSVQLSSTIDDDGLPNNALTFSWVQVSGPGSSNIVPGTLSGNTLLTDVTVTTPGIYVLRLTASDGALSSSDDVQITLDDVAPPLNVAPTVSAGVDQSIQLPTNAVQLSSTIDDDGLPNNALTFSWAQVSGPGSSNIVPGTLNGNTLLTDVTVTTPGIYVLRLTASDGALSSSDDVQITLDDVAPPLNVAPTVSAGADQSIQLPTNAVQLSSTIDDDGLPNNALTFSWAQVSGPGTSNIVPGILNGNTLLTDVTVTTPGIYVLRLTASDGALSSSDDVQITLDDVAPPLNVAPTVSAGVDQSIQLPTNAVQLSSTIDDDGLPNNALTFSWAQVSGPGSSNIVPGTLNGNTLLTDVTVTTPGIYVLRLTASDGALSSSDDVQITLDDVAPPLNVAPTVSAGADQSIQLPTNAVQLSSTIDDDGLPNNALTFSWAQVSGPGTSNIVPGILNGNTLLTDVTVTTPGIYVLRLTASDGALSSSDDVQITLEAEDVPPPTGESPVLSGVSAFWRFDENAGIIATDSSGIGNTGALQNLDASHWQPGVYNNALCLNGSANQQVSITNPIGLDTPSVTVAGWIKLNPNISNWVWVGGHGDNYGLYVYGDGIYFYIYTGSTWKSVYFDNAGLLDSEWHHVAGSFDADTGIASVFKDGVLLNGAYFPDQISYSQGSGASIGSMQGLRSFDGCLDEIQFYGRALSETEVNTLSGQ